MTHSARLMWALGALVLSVIGCVTVPSGPTVMVLPGSGKDFASFQADDQTCRGFAVQQTGMSPEQAQVDSAVRSGMIGTAVGAAAGALVGAAGHDPGAGAAIGAGTGLVYGTAAGAAAGEGARAALQQRYDNAYVQCMYASGHQVPVADASPAPPPVTRTAPRPPHVPPPPGSAPLRSAAPGSSFRPPPPPPGAPPPPPPMGSSPSPRGTPTDSSGLS